MFLDVIVATKNTPLATELAIRSLLYWNSGFKFNLFIGDCGDEENRSDFGCLSVKHYEKFPRNTTHGTIITELYHRCNSQCLLIMDSDVEFSAPMIDPMHAVLSDDPRCFAVSNGIQKAETWSYPKAAIEWEGSQLTRLSSEGVVYQERACPFISLWKNDDLLKKAVSLFGFDSAFQFRNAREVKYWDTTSLLYNVLNFSGFHARTIDLPGFRHFGSLSHDNKKYKELMPYLQNKLQELQNGIMI